MVTFSWPNKRKSPASGRNPDDVFLSAQCAAFIVPTSCLFCQRMCYEFGATGLVGKSGRGHVAVTKGAVMCAEHAGEEYIVRASPAAGDFLLFGQEKSHQREGHPGVARGARTLCCLLDLGGCGTRPAADKYVSAGLEQSSPTPPRPSELLGATQGPQILTAQSSARALRASYDFGRGISCSPVNMRFHVGLMMISLTHACGGISATNRIV